jgi:regulator of RNase E activity RraA
MKPNFVDLTTAHLADACLRLQVRPRCLSLQPVSDGQRLAGPARPVQHFGSVDVFLEAIDRANAGDVLVIDNGGRLDEACIGDLVAIEAKAAGLAGIVVWGKHRDTAEIRQVELPVFSLGSIATGPIRLDERNSSAFDLARFGNYLITAADYVAADDDGVIFLPRERVDRIREQAASIRDTEIKQAAMVEEGRSLRSQMRFAEYLQRRSTDPNLTFRDHLQNLGAEIEVRF